MILTVTEFIMNLNVNKSMTIDTDTEIVTFENKQYTYKTDNIAQITTFTEIVI